MKRQLAFQLGASQVSSLLVYPVDFGISGLYNHISQFLKISIYLSSIIYIVYYSICIGIVRVGIKGLGDVESSQMFFQLA